MRLTRTSTWLSGIFLIFLLFGIDRGLIILGSEKTTGEVIGFHTTPGKSPSKAPKINFEYNGHTYTFVSTRFSFAHIGDNVPVLFDPDDPVDPVDAYENTFGGFWFWGLFAVALAFVMWSAAALSFVGKNERVVLTWKKVWLEKIKMED